ncbi:MAG: ubiquinone/menaquinone biosynthesis methyltransferase [Spirochaetota bacterium]
MRENFDVIARKYDIFNDLNSFFLHRHWKNAITRILDRKFPDSFVCLDLCCGTGDISVRIHKNTQASKVYSVDFSENMLAIARNRMQTTPNSDVRIGDATNLQDFADKSLDAVTIGFGLRNVDNLQSTLDEIMRVLKPGGMYINLDVGKVKNPFIRFFADFYFFKIVPFIGYILWGKKNEMFDYLPVSSLHYPAQEELQDILLAAGFTDVSFRNFAFGNVALHVASKPLDTNPKETP